MSEWYYAKNGQQTGPLTLADLQRLAASGELAQADPVWREGMADWTTAGAVPELWQAAAPQGYAPPPQAYAPPPQAYAPQQPYQQPYGQSPTLNYGGYAPAGGPLGYYTPHAVPYAGFWTRFGAAFIDGLIIGIPWAIVYFGIMYAMGAFDSANLGGGGYSSGPYGSRRMNNADPTIQMVDLGLRLVQILIGWLYYATMESGPHQATYGKRALGIKVVDQYGNRITFARASGRYFGKQLSGCLCLIGYIMAAFTERKQALHDIMASTLVVQK